VGNRAGWSVAAELGYLHATLGNSSVLFDATTDGSGSYRTYRLGLGPTWCAIENDTANGHCTLSFTGQLVVDYTSLRNDSARIYRLGVESRGTFFGDVGLLFELGSGYPAAGHADYTLSAGDGRSGTAIAIVLQKAFTWYTGSGGAPSAGRRARDDDTASDEATGSSDSTPESGDVSAPVASAPRGTEWASRVAAFSSQYGNPNWSAKQVLGPPNVYPMSADDQRAWASGEADRATEFIEVRFEQPQRIRQVLVYETLNPGAITNVVVSGSSGARVTLDQRTTTRSDQGSQISAFDVACTAEPVDTARVNLHSGSVAGWNELDAIGIVPCSAPPLSRAPIDDSAPSPPTDDPPPPDDVDGSGTPTPKE
jgi:hypothetical protein